MVKHSDIAGRLSRVGVKFTGNLRDLDTHHCSVIFRQLLVWRDGQVHGMLLQRMALLPSRRTHARRGSITPVYSISFLHTWGWKACLVQGSKVSKEEDCAHHQDMQLRSGSGHHFLDCSVLPLLCHEAAKCNGVISAMRDLLLPGRKTQIATAASSCSFELCPDKNDLRTLT